MSMTEEITQLKVCLPRCYGYHFWTNLVAAEGSPNWLDVCLPTSGDIEKHTNNVVAIRMLAMANISMALLSRSQQCMISDIFCPTIHRSMS